ncbi:MAG: hypothetical protein Q8Q11_00440 [bacterium]|nr:hypothetical protein [bacterium]MDZ4247813.1 hypothetical protein [Patescibacteria group bacterium]
MPTIAPPDTHEIVRNDPEVVPNPIIDEEPEPEEETPDEGICHLQDDNCRTLCGADGLAMPLSGLQNPKASPCEGGCGYARCQQCVSFV